MEHFPLAKRTRWHFIICKLRIKVEDVLLVVFENPFIVSYSNIVNGELGWKKVHPYQH